MREIQPVNILIKGTYKAANFFSVKSMYDDLSTRAIFEYSYIYVIPGIIEILQTEKIEMDGQAYVDWNANPDINDAAYAWVGSQVNVIYI